MNRPTAFALTGCLIVLVAYIVVTSASLVRELNSSNATAATPPEKIAGAALQVSQPAPNDNRVDIPEAQPRSARRHRFKAVNHHGKPRIKQEPVTLYL
jgi:hypothetical protein